VILLAGRLPELYGEGIVYVCVCVCCVNMWLWSSDGGWQRRLVHCGEDAVMVDAERG
jgi:hypothetical protein